ncbi:MAG: ABC transporter permease, partial [Gemmatimonadaceae bacterium]
MSAFSDVIERLRTLVFRRQEERELEEELQFHVSMEADAQKDMGYTTSEAHRRSLMALGGIEQTKENVRDARGTRVIEDSIADFKQALYALRKRPSFAIVAILTLALGIGGTTAVYSAVDAVLLQPLPYQESGQMVRLYQHFVGTKGDNYVTPVHFLAYRQQLSSFESFAAISNYRAASADIGGSTNPERIRLLPISAEYFGVLRVKPMLGRVFRTEEENGAPVVIVNEALWRRVLGADPTVIGKPLVMSGTSFTVVGVMADSVVDPVEGHIDAWVPTDLTPGKDPSNANNHYLSVIARLRNTSSIGRAQAEIDKLGEQLALLYTDGAAKTRAHLQPLKENVVGSASRSLMLMLGAVFLVLVMVCVNIANLLLVRSSERAREFAVRSALGAKRSRLIRQLLVESLTLAILGAAAGLVVARLAMSGMVILGDGAIPRLATLTLEPRLLAFAIGIATVCAVLFGLAPALRMTRAQPSDVLRQQARSTTGNRAQSRLRESLVVAQVALAFVMLVGASLLLASFRRLQQVELGVNTANVIAYELQLPSSRYDSTARALFYERVAAREMQIPGVKSAGGISKLPATGGYNEWGTRPTSGPMASRLDDIHLSVQQRVVSGEYFRTVGVKLLQGRLFDARDVAGTPPRAVISKMVADAYFSGVNPIGQEVETADGKHEVIGVVSDVSVNSEGRLEAVLYHAHAQFAGDRNWELTQVVLASGDPTAMINSVRSTLAELDPQLVMFKPAPLSEIIGRGVASRVFTLRILTAFALVALSLAALGLFGVLSFTVKLRTQEFGIR